MANRIEYIYSLVNRYSKPLDKMRAAQKLFQKETQRAEQDIKRFQSKLSTFTTVAATGGIIALGGAVTKMVSEASKIENVTAAFTPLMGSADKARELVEKLNHEAATTPFQFGAISSTAKQLLPVMSGNIEKVAATFRMLGDTAGGNAQKLDTITRGYTKAMLKGKVDMEALNMISEAGVPILNEMSKAFGVSTQQLFKMSSQGKLTTDMLTQTFQRMTSEGGIFYKGMEISSKTLSGLMSTLRDNINLAAAGIGETLLPIIKEYVKSAIETAGRVREWVSQNKELIATKINEWITKAKKILTGLIKAFKVLWPVIKVIAPAIMGIVIAMKAYRIIMMAVVIAMKAWKIMTIVIMGVQMVLNAILTANPIGLIIVGIGALIAAIALLVIYFKQVRGFIVKAFNNEDVLLFIAALQWIYAPIGMVIAGVAGILENWQAVKNAFKTGNIGKIVLTIGKAIISGLLKPIQAVLNAASKIPGIGKGFKKAADVLGKFREGLFADEMTAEQLKNMEKEKKGTQEQINKAKELREKLSKPINMSAIISANKKRLNSISDIKKTMMQKEKKYAFENKFISAPTMIDRETKGTAKTESNINLSVYTEKGMNVVPYQRGENLGYNLVGAR